MILYIQKGSDNIFTKQKLEYLYECIETQEEGLTPSKFGNQLKEKIKKELDNQE